ncbi:MAG: DUF1330 domain-containing protein [Casimicrobiaceae bacterium]
MATYVIADIEVTDPAGYEEYRQKAPASIAAFGGRYLARGGATETLEGAWLPQRCVILEFPTTAAFKAWWASPEYTALRAIRQRTTKSRLIVTEGLAAA